MSEPALAGEKEPAAPALGSDDGGREAPWSFADRAGPAEVRFLGRGAAAAPAALTQIAPRIGSAPLELAWARQVHSARVLAARPGFCGEGDALWTARSGLALCVVTADCVPVLLATAGGIAAVHAGWRGLAAGVVPAALAALPGGTRDATAWLGPAIGPCCYEVGPEVAAAVAAASGEGVIRPGPGGRPQLDLHLAASIQLEAAGVESVRAISDCTRCGRRRLWSHRGDGAAAGRNLSFIFLSDSEGNLA